jgi:hypothetical protein
MVGLPGWWDRPNPRPLPTQDTNTGIHAPNGIRTRHPSIERSKNAWALWWAINWLLFYLFKYRPIALGPTQPPGVPVVPSPGVKHGRGMTLTTHYLVQRSRIRRSYSSSLPPPPQVPPWRVAGQLYFIRITGFHFKWRHAYEVRFSDSVFLHWAVMWFTREL